MKPYVIKPIFGCEVYFTPDDTLARDRKPDLYHMILIATNEIGYVNLMQTVSEAAVEGFYYRPRVTLDNLRRHSEGLIATSACLSGIVMKNLDRGKPCRGASLGGDLPRPVRAGELLHRDPRPRHHDRKR